MKKFRFPMILLPLLAAVVQAQVTTAPVGFVSITSPASSDTPIGLPLRRSPVLQTTVTNISGNVMTVPATLTSQFGGAMSDTFYVRVLTTVNTSSAVKGSWYSVTGITTSAPFTITVDSGSTQNVQTQGLAANDTIEVIPFWTLDTLLPLGQGLTITTNIDSFKDQVGFMPSNVSGVNLQPAQLNAYINDTVNGITSGWYNSGDFTPSGSTPIAPDDSLFFRNAGVAKTLTVTGTVLTGSASTPIGRLATGTGQDNFTGNPFPVPISLTESRLFESGAFAATTNIDSPQDAVLVYDGSEVGANAQPSRVYIYAIDSVNGVFGWVNAGDYSPSTTKILLPGRAFVIRKAPGVSGTVAWRADPTY